MVQRMAQRTWVYRSERVKKKRKKKQENPEYPMTPDAPPSKNSKSISLYTGHSGRGAGIVWLAAEWRRHTKVAKRTIASSGEGESRLCLWTTAFSEARTVKNRHM